MPAGLAVPSRCAGCAFDSSQARNAVPICAAPAPRASTAASAAAVADAAGRDHRRRARHRPPAARATACRSATPPPIAGTTGDARRPRLPVATMASTPASSSARASSTVVAVPRVRMPSDRQRSRIAARRDAEDEAEDRRPRLEERGHLILEARIGHGRERRRRNLQLGEQRRQRRDRGVEVAPRHVRGCRRVRGRHPEVDGERSAGQGAQPGHDRADLLRRHPLQRRRSPARPRWTPSPRAASTRDRRRTGPGRSDTAGRTAA